jgi:quercetin dioxygenase-like cupin family protein
MEIRRFGIGHRRREGPSGTHGVDGQSIHADRRGAIAELAFRPNAAMAPYSNPNPTYFVVIEGGGFVQVGDARARVAAGEAVVWPPNVIHAAWTEQTPMRALVVEFAVDGPGVLMLDDTAAEPAEGSNAERPTTEGSKPEPSMVDGGLVSGPGGRPDDHESPDREPW